MIAPASTAPALEPPPAVRTRPSGGDGAILIHLRTSEIFRDFQQAFEAITGLPLALRQAGSFEFPLHGSRQLNPFCALMSQRSKSCSSCLQLQHRLEEEATHQPATLVCGAGLQESAVPLRAGEQLLGFLRTGQVFHRPPTRRNFRRFIRDLGDALAAAELPALEAAYFQTRVVPRSQYDSALRLVAIFAEHLAAVSNRVLVRAATAEGPAMTRARAFIALHQAEDLRLRDVAQAVNLSTYYFCKLFKGATGFTFTHYLARQRVEVVRALLLQTHTRVTEAAYAAGFQSLSQFNRVFRRVTGESASDFRRGQPDGRERALKVGITHP